MRGLAAKLTGGEKCQSYKYINKYGTRYNIFSPSVAYGDSSLIRGSQGRCRARRFFDTLKKAATFIAAFLMFLDYAR